MRKITKENYQEIIQGQKVVVFFHKSGCSNCEAMTPLLEEFEKENPDIQVCSYHAVPDTETKKYDEIVSQFNFKVFPLVVCYSNGKILFARFSVFSPDILSIPFSPIEILQNNFFQTEVMLNQVIKEHREKVQAIRDENFVRSIVIQNLIAIQNGVSTQEMDWELPTPTIAEEDKKSCETCQ